VTHGSGSTSIQRPAGIDRASYRASHSSWTCCNIRIAGSTEGPEASGGRLFFTASMKSKITRAALSCSFSKEALAEFAVSGLSNHQLLHAYSDKTDEERSIICLHP
jgi:hypothetical protein